MTTTERVAAEEVTDNKPSKPASDQNSLAVDDIRNMQKQGNKIYFCLLIFGFVPERNEYKKCDKHTSIKSILLILMQLGLLSKNLNKNLVKILIS
jgi:hypothetical protein